MAGSKYAYVRTFELPDPVLPNVYMVVRIDGKGFHKFSAAHDFEKPNDAPALELMNEAARHVMRELKGDIMLAFGESDEYSFLLRRACTLYNRRESKITTHIVSMFTAGYIYHWNTYFPGKPLRALPSFDGRLVPYPTIKEVRDYFAWRQVDTHINNLYNTTFWALVQQGGQSEREAAQTLAGTVSGDKNDILFSRFDINYERLPALFRKGTTLLWSAIAPEPEGPPSGADRAEKPEHWRHRSSPKVRKELTTVHLDIIGDTFWSSPSSEADPTPDPPLPPAKSETQPWLDPRRTNPLVTIGPLE